MKEMQKGDNKTRFGWTDVLDPDSKPYLCLDGKGNYHVLYWRARFAPGSGEWLTSDWWHDATAENLARVDVKRVWRLPTVKYAKPKLYTHQKHLRQRVKVPK